MSDGAGAVAGAREDGSIRELFVAEVALISISASVGRRSLFERCKSTICTHIYESNIPFCVSVPVLSLSKYSIRPNSSGRVLVRTIVLGISLSVMICCAYTVLPISKLTRRLSSIARRHMYEIQSLRYAPDGYYGREQNEEAENIDVPKPSESVQRHQDQR